MNNIPIYNNAVIRDTNFGSMPIPVNRFMKRVLSETPLKWPLTTPVGFRPQRVRPIPSRLRQAR